MLIPLVSLGLRMLGWQRLMRYLERMDFDSPQLQATNLTLDYAHRMACLTNVAAGRRLIRATCLERSIVLWWLLTRRGIDSRIVFGARKEPGGLRAHAWVEYEGTVINDQPEVHDGFAVMHSFGGWKPGNED